VTEIQKHFKIITNSIMTARLYTVEYGFIRPLGVIIHRTALLTLIYGTESEALAILRQREADALQRYGKDTDLAILKITHP
jgi:hypothetical protein